MLTQPVTVAAVGQYFSGGVLANAPTVWQVTTSQATYTPPNWSDFTFGVSQPYWMTNDFGPVRGVGFALQTLPVRPLGHPGASARTFPRRACQRRHGKLEHVAEDVDRRLATAVQRLRTSDGLEGHAWWRSGQVCSISQVLWR